MNRSPWDRVPTEPLGIEGVRMCFSCKQNKHYECEHHVNDGVVDALEFINVGCNCPCKGEVREKGGLIKLVFQLRQDDRCLRLQKELNYHRDYIDELGSAVREFLFEDFDDEGDSTNSAQERISAYMHALESLQRAYEEKINDQMKGQE